MDISNIASVGTAMAQQSLDQKVNLSLLKTALNVQANSVTQILATVPSANLPSNVGQNVNTKV